MWVRLAVKGPKRTRKGGVFSIRIAASHDAEEILQCLDQAFAPYRSSYTPGAFADTVLSREMLRKRFIEMTVLVAVDFSGCVIGTIAYKVQENGEGHLRGMAVRPEWHGSEVAKKLLEQSESDLRDLHCKAITLDTTKPLQRAIRFYEKNGFRATGEVASFFRMELFAYRKEI
ncbi:MAG: GNAT family N-acetyltransferase [Candidatus Acidiferrales bacterium]